jgi:hypothetical protein
MAGLRARARYPKDGRVWFATGFVVQSRASIRYGRETQNQKCFPSARNWESVLFPGARLDKDS